MFIENLDTELRDAVRQRVDIPALVCMMDRKVGLLVSGPHASAATATATATSAENMVQASVAMPGHPDLVMIGVANAEATTKPELLAWLEEVAGKL